MIDGLLIEESGHGPSQSSAGPRQQEKKEHGSRPRHGLIERHVAVRMYTFPPVAGARSSSHLEYHHHQKDDHQYDGDAQVGRDGHLDHRSCCGHSGQAQLGHDQDDEEEGDRV